MKIATITVTSLALASLTAGVAANQTGRDVDDAETMQNTQSMDHMEDQASNVQTGEERQNAREVLNESERVLQNMKREEGMDAALEQAKGVFLVPDFGRGAFVFGGRGGQGVVLTKQNGDWNGPAFFNFGAVSAGAQGGAAAGEVAMLLMTDKAVESFKQDHNFALNADAGLTLLDWSNAAQGSYGKGDVLFWSSTEGLFAGGAISVSDVFSDDEANQEYYTRAATAEAILEGEVEDNSDAAGSLKTMLP
jgi:SH3 domain-containing YSC84-like protein 1|tara:strand:- start:7 stop:756 length:750 start_codon:yes stop_codon:yes gene_type:complete